MRSEKSRRQSYRDQARASIALASVALDRDEAVIMAEEIIRSALYELRHYLGEVKAYERVCALSDAMITTPDAPVVVFTVPRDRGGEDA
jgi:hypothetical protein